MQLGWVIFLLQMCLIVLIVFQNNSQERDGKKALLLENSFFKSANGKVNF